MKYAYAGSAAYTHDAYARSDDYLAMLVSARQEAEALLDSGILDPTATTIAEIGPGNGRRSGAFLARLADGGRPCRRYLALDFSATLLSLACARLTHSAGAAMTVDARLWDIECGSSDQVERWRPADGPVVSCLLGHTLGNVDSPAAALGNIHAGLRPGDVLLVSVLLRCDEGTATTLAPYRSQAFRAAALEPLLAAGIAEADLGFDLSFHDGVVTGAAVLEREVVVDGTCLPAGHRIHCFQSRRFSCSDVTGAVAQAGWHVRDVVTEPGGVHLVVTATRG
ncbi:L-histidine N(alpha)-methyltransferase [Micromonospora humida]|uniref:L-histidine N(alpha)-methyltransferase n=1 Tax=Micromonospora humida TaxID=2809018 RepID=UPI003422BBE9